MKDLKSNNHRLAATGSEGVLASSASSGSRPRRSPLLVRLLTLLVATIGSLGVAEGLLRIVETYTIRYITPIGRLPLGQRVLAMDPVFGFRPILGTSAYNEYGTRPNEYSPEKRPGIQRLLFIGDSVTHRGRIITALREVYGDEKYEYWNAGVESFDVMQEVMFYKLANARLRPDHVILTFHNNDLEVTPIILMGADGETTYSPARSLTGRNPWLMAHVHLYRLWVDAAYRAAGGRDAVVRGTITSLREFADVLERDRIEFTVLVLPIFKPLNRWSASERQKRTEALTMLREHRIRHFDLLPFMQKALRNGIDCQESPGDPWHPSDAVSRVFAESLKEKGLLEGLDRR